MRMSWLFGRNNALRAPLVIALLVLTNALFLRAAGPVVLSGLRIVAALRSFMPGR